MKIGFVFECGPKGADEQVCEYLAMLIRPGVVPVSRTLDNKANLIRDAGRVAVALLADGCERVLIVWDLRPAWPDKKTKPCRHDERVALLKALEDAGVSSGPVFLVCVEQELECWLLADEARLSAYLSTSEHPFVASRVRRPDRVKNPKALMMNYFRTARGWRYEDRTHAIQILRVAGLDLKRLKRSASFARFESKLTEDFR